MNWITLHYPIDSNASRMSTHTTKLSTQEKALRINLDGSVYGSFAEIGAGQEVASSFFKVGGASGTVAKTISAYDMKFSDAIYGQCDRYVCEDRLLQMLDHEYELLPQRLSHRITDTRFFAFADTVETINFRRTNEGHGWLGLCFQRAPGSPPNELVIHVRLKDNDAIQQQMAIGILGVNMLYGVLYLDTPEEIMLSLLDGLTTRRVEVDMLRLIGPDYANVDNRLLALQLVKHGLSRVAMFGPDGSVLQPSEVLYKKNVLLLRGRFRPATLVAMDMLERGMELFSAEPDVAADRMVTLCELNLSDLNLEGNIDEIDFLNRAEIISHTGNMVIISNYPEYYRLSEYMTRITRDRKIGFVIGIHSFRRMFDEKSYEGLRGGILESFAHMFGSNIKLYVYPALKLDGPGLFTLDDLEASLSPEHKGLYQYLVDNNKLHMVETFNQEHLSIISDNVLAMIRGGDPGWEQMVPDGIASVIRSRRLFGYR